MATTRRMFRAQATIKHRLGRKYVLFYRLFPLTKHHVYSSPPHAMPPRPPQPPPTQRRRP